MRNLLIILFTLALVAGCDNLPPYIPDDAPPEIAPAITEKLEVLDFFATWCGPCALQAPKIKMLENDGYDIRRVNVDKEEELVSEYKIHSVPTYVVLIDGDEVYRTQNAWTLADWLRQHDERSVQKSQGKVPDVSAATRKGKGGPGTGQINGDRAAGDKTVETCLIRDRHLYINVRGLRRAGNAR